MKKLGFTLSEALLALGIIGVVAALTLPSVTLEHRKRTQSATLAAAVSDFETAMSVMIMRDGVYDILETKAWKNLERTAPGQRKLDSSSNKEKAEDFNNKVKFFTKPLGGGLANYYPDGKVYTFNKIIKNVDTISKETPFEMKNGILYGLYIDREEENKNDKDEVEMLNNGTNLYAVAAEVWIDVNGKNKPNTIGRDIFKFFLGADGKLYPFGGKDHALWNDSIPSDSLGFTKTADLVKNNYKMNY